MAEGRNEYEWGGHPARPKISGALDPFRIKFALWCAPAGTGKMPILQVRPKAARDCSRPWRRAPTIKIIRLLSNAVRLCSLFPMPDWLKP
ncbi:hypothetical protein BJP34_33165 [Moorena producens PAL-8-15-08-1]|uniref:Uncharacterized protein n=1 Tax=Moorena producens PAL-8-15-08-1 TaxID=1458985 RepID=A0A1D8U1S3_9CYAN|nr:hypothetical protein BJP34_33165 [Moorena producens PAL-8-15-08-1]